MLPSGLRSRMVWVGMVSGVLGVGTIAAFTVAPLPVVLVCIAASLLLSIAVAYLGGVRPIEAQIARVQRVATRVGTENGFTPIETDARDLIGGLARELDKAHARIRADAAELEASRKDLQVHLADVAHDLRTPVTSIQLALERAFSLQHKPEELEAVLTQAVNDVIYLGGLTANLRLASQLEKRWPVEPGAAASLNDTVDRAVTRVRFLAQRKGMSLDHALPDEGLRVGCDPIELEQAVGNVVENAVTHGHKGGHVAVLLRATASAGFEIVVVDDGPGVAADEIPRLGNRTFRTDAARRRDARGSGLGLAITRAVCERHGFALGFSHETPTGLRVTISGPRVDGSRTPAEGVLKA